MTRALDWQRLKPGWYEAVDSEGTRWRIVQRTSSAWEIFELGVAEHAEGDSLSDAQWTVHHIVRCRVDPEYAERQRARREKPRQPSSGSRKR